MAAKQRKRILLGQNFLRDSRLARELVSASTLGRDDTVFEIGPGRGMITAELAWRAGKVIAIEKDPALVRRLRERFRAVDNIRIVEADFLNHRIEERSFKIFANIPYNITAQVMRKILDVPAASERSISDNAKRGRPALRRLAAGNASLGPRKTVF